MCAKPRSVPEDPFVQLNLFNPVAGDSKIAIGIAGLPCIAGHIYLTGD
jgi:hypothetical protein